MDIDLFILKMLNGSDSVFLDHLAVSLTNGWVWIPLYIMFGVLVVKNNKTMSQIFLIFGCGVLGVLLSGVLSDLIIKPIVMRPRPLFDPALQHLVQTVPGYKVSGYSFFSSHAANTMSLAVFFTILVRSTRLSVILFAWTLTNCWTRIYLGVHWFTDVLTGAVWGAIVAVAMYFIYRKVFYMISPRVKYVSSQYTSTGYALKDINMCILVVLFTCIYCIIKSIIY